MSATPTNDLLSSKIAWIACVGLIAILSLGLAGIIWAMDSPRTVGDFNNRFDTLRNLEANWDTEILSLQLGIAPNYDAVTLASRDLQLGLASLEESVSEDQSLAPLLPSLQAYHERVVEKDRLSEQVKASYAMLRNSATVLPTAIADAFSQPGILDPISGLNKRPSDLITEIITGMMSFTISPTQLSQDAVKAGISASQAVMPNLSEGLSASIQRFIAQVEVVIRERQRGNELMLAITAIPTDAAADMLQADIQSLEADDISLQRRLWDLALLLGAMLALAFACFVFVLSRRFAQLDKDNRMLQQVKEDAEEQLVQSAKLSALGQMVAGITHEINTPLAYVKAVFELIKERIMGDMDAAGPSDTDVFRENREELQILLEDGLHGLEEITTLVRTMKNFSRLDKGLVESFSVEEGIESALLIARPQLKYVADIQREFDTVPPIMCSPSQIRQVLLNLVVNAAQAIATMEKRGILTVRTRITTSDTVVIDICDNGPGIPEENIGKIFDPFFTTKPVGEGSGMGLSICYRIIENHGGTITVNSKPGKGTVFTITLPRQGEKVPEKETQGLRFQEPATALPAPAGV